MPEREEDPRSMHYTLDDVVEIMARQKAELTRLRTLLNFASRHENHPGASAFEAIVGMRVLMETLKHDNAKLVAELMEARKALLHRDMIEGHVRSLAEGATSISGSCADPDCDLGPCGCAGVSRLLGWSLDPAAVLRALDAPPAGEEPEVDEELLKHLIGGGEVSQRVIDALGGPQAVADTVWDFTKPAAEDKPTAGGPA